MANPEDEEHPFEQSSSAQQQSSELWNRNVEQSTALNSNDEVDAVRPIQRPTATRFEHCQQINKQEDVCNCECCFSNSIPLSSSIVHIDENESDDEYLDAENYTTANSTLDDLTETDQQSNLTNLINSNNNFSTAISSHLFFNLNNQPSNCVNTDHNIEFTDHSHQTTNSSSSFCKSDSSSLITKTTSTTTTTSITNNSSHQQSQINHKCHCRLNTFVKPARPLSLSSISSSSSSCCSLSRNNSLALSDHLKKPYLASIESLGDDELNVNKYNQLNSDEHSLSSGISSGCHSHSETNSASSTEPSVHSTCSCCVLRSNSNLSLVRSASTNSNQSQCRCSHLDNYEQDYCSTSDAKRGDDHLNHPNSLIYHPSAYQTINNQTVNTLSQMDRVIMEIVQTESAYVKDLNEIIEGYFVYLNKRLFEASEHVHQMKKASNDYETDEDETHTNQQSFEVSNSNSILKSSTNSKQTKRNLKQRGKSKLVFTNLNNNQFNLDESSTHIQQQQTSHTLPKSTKQLQNSIKLRSQQEQTVNNQSSSTQECRISPEQLISLFGNLNDIYQFNSMFLNQLMQCDFEPVQIAQCFVDNEDGFHVYSQYCTNYPKQVETLSELNRNPYTNQLLKTRQIELGHSLPLFSYLLKPVQRILKYHLLLNNMVKHFEIEQQTTDQTGKTDAVRSLRNALNVMTNIATHINTMKKKHEHAVRVQEIQSLLIGWQGDDLTTFGELVAEGTFKMFGNKTSRHLFLFDKMLLVVKKKDDSLFTYKAHILCSNLMLIESIRSEPLCFHAIPFNNPKIQYTFQAKNLDQKREWCLLLKNVILESYQAIPSHAKQIVLGLGQKTSGLNTENKHKVFPVHLNRKLSAPEYLEKRCKAQQNKASSNNLINCNNTNTNLSLGLQFSNLQKGFRLRKSLKKSVPLISGRNSAANNLMNNNLGNNSGNNASDVDMNKEMDKSDKASTDLPMHLMDHNNDLTKSVEQRETNELISSYEENNHAMEISYNDKLVSNDIPSCLSSTSLTTTNDSYTDSGVGSTNSVCCYSQLATPISLGSSIASIESNATTTTANSYSTGYSRSTNSSTKLVSLCSGINQSAGNQSSTDDFNELMINEQLRDHESNIKLANGIKQPTFKNKRCTNRCCHNDLANRYGAKMFDSSPSASLTRFDSETKANYLHHHSKFYRHSKYLHLNHPEEVEFRPQTQVRRVQSFTIGNKNLNSRLLTNYSSTSNKSFALNAGCSSSNNGSALLQHTVSFRKSPNDLVLAKLRHLHRRPGIVAAQKQMYKQQKMQQLNEMKLQELNLNNNNNNAESESTVSNLLNEDKPDAPTKSNDESNSKNQTERMFDSKEDCSSSDDDEKEDEKKAKKFIKPNSKLSKTKDSNSMEELSPTLPEIWLKKHEKHYFKDNMKLKSGSLPRNFEGFL